MYRFSVSLLVIAQLTLLLPAEGLATTYYVRSDGNDTSCDGLGNVAASSAPNCAWQTPAKGLGEAQPGDTVILSSGPYSAISSVRSGTTENPVALKGASGETVSVSRVTLDHDYLVVSDLRITGSGTLGNAGLQINGDHNQVLRNKVLGNCPGAGGNQCAGMEIRGDSNEISDNLLDGQGNGETTSFVWGMHISGSYNDITRNLIKETNSVERVWELYGTQNRIAFNEVRDVDWTIGSISHPDIVQVFGHGSSTDHIIEGNYFHDFQGQLGNLRPQGGGPWEGWIFRNNVIANVDMELFIWMPVTFHNNTFFNVARGNTGWPLFVYTSGYVPGYVTSRNNAFIACGSNSNNGWFNVGNGDYDYVSETAIGASKSDNFSQTHGVNGGSPDLVGAHTDCVANVCDFQIGSESVLIDAGSALTEVSDDGCGSRSVSGRVATRRRLDHHGGYEQKETVRSPLS